MADDVEGTPLRGFEAVADALAAEDFPMDAEGVDYSVGDIEVEDGRGGWVPVRDALDRVAQKQFATAADLLRALREAVKRKR